MNEIIETTSGKVKGIVVNGQLKFLGIPYAQPPVGDLRFKRARPVQPWTGVLEATAYGPMSVQFDKSELKGEENCLTLNIQRPLEGMNLPVLVWIHGGGFNTGAASDPLYDGSAFVNEGILYISIQYRLNVLGFYDFTMYPEAQGFESNCGISDQVMALQWIHDNVESFGGNPSQITIAGESAGGTSVTNMLAIPAVSGLFQQAIAASAIPDGVLTHEQAKPNMDLFIEGMGWEAKDLNRLHTIHPFEMQKGNTYVADHFQDRNPGIYLPSPVLDDIIPEKPIEAIKNGSAAGIRLMIGTNLHEGTMFVHKEKTVFPNSWSMIEDMFTRTCHQDQLTRIRDYYQAGSHEDFNGIDESLVQFATDYAFQVPALKVAEAQRQYGDVWMYRYEYISEFGRKSGTGASHAYELPCVFKNRDFEFSQMIFAGEPEEKIESIMNDIHMLWVQFIKTGHPGIDGWAKFAGYDSKIYILDENSRTVQLNRADLMEVWGDLKFYA